MPIGTEESRAVDAVVRSLATALKTLRLYPASSPIPMQAMEATTDALAGALAAQPTLPLVVAREGFTFRGAPLNAPGGGDLAAVLTSHGVAQIDFLPGCTPTEVAAFLNAIGREVPDVRAEGGIAAVLAIAGATNMVVSEVVLTTVVTDVGAVEDIDAFLRELAADEQKLAAWLAAACAGDPGALSDGLTELARAVGADGLAGLEKALGRAYLVQDAAGRDTVVGLALGDSEAVPVLQGMLQLLQPRDFASSVAGGLYAKNMLSMSNVLASIPPASTLDAIIEELRPLLAEEGHTERELGFLGHMLEARAQAGLEAPLADRLPDYKTVAAVSRVDDATIDTARTELAGSTSTVNARTVNTLLSLLDQQKDFTLWSRTLANLASVVPSLIAQHELALAERVFADLSGRESRTSQPWPGLADEMRAAFDRAASIEAMTALLEAVLDDPSAVAHVKAILAHAGTAAQQRFVSAAVTQRERDGLAAAEAVLGRRVLDLLVVLAPDVEWYQVGPVAARLSQEADPRARDALLALARRRDEHSRQELAKGLSGSSAAIAVEILAALARDPSLEVSVIAVRALGRTGGPGAAAALDGIYTAIDATGKDFALAREVLGSLSRTPDPGANDVLARIAGQRTLIKRGHFAEILDLARQAQVARAGGGVRP